MSERLRIIVTGSRDWSHPLGVWLRETRELYEVVRLAHGGAPGADSIADRCAKTARIEVAEYPALWERFGHAAGPVRNREMIETEVQLAAAASERLEVHAFHPDLRTSRGTRSAFQIAQAHQLPTFLWESPADYGG